MTDPKRIESGIKLVHTQSGERRYVVRLKDRSGRWYPAEWFERLVDARRYKEKLMADRGRNQAAQTVEQRRMLFEEYWNVWLAECRSSVSEGWRGEQERMARAYILPRLSKLRLCDIRSRDIGNTIDAVKRKGLGEGMQRHVYNLLHKAFEDAIEHFEYLESSPVIRRYCPKVHRKKRPFLHPNESTQLLQHVRGDFMEAAIMLGLMVGLRPGEIQALTWENVDLEKAQISICASFKRRVMRIEPFPKQKDHGQATIPRPLLDYLTKRRSEKGPKDFVAAGEGGGMLNYHVFYKRLRQLCRSAGVQVVTPHELRHSCTELWVFNGASQEDCGRQLNHANASTTERYMHRTSDRLQAIGANFAMPGMPSDGPRNPGLRLVRDT